MTAVISALIERRYNTHLSLHFVILKSTAPEPALGAGLCVSWGGDDMGVYVVVTSCGVDDMESNVVATRRPDPQMTTPGIEMPQNLGSRLALRAR